jgi:hypothetical protein
MRTMLIAAAAGLSLAASTAAYADSGDGPAANSFFTELPGVVAQADLPNATAYAQAWQAHPQQAQNGQGVELSNPVEPRHLVVPGEPEPGAPVA